MRQKILVGTACGNKKRPGIHKAIDLYKSARIKAVYNRREGCDMAILSAKYGLVDSESFIKDYNEVMNLERANVLLPGVIEYLKKYDVIVYFKA